MKITLQSFGYKHGYTEADMVFDVRFLPNPYWVPELQPLDGRDPQVALYVLNNDKGRTFLEKFEPLVLYLLEEHSNAGRETLSLAIGCTGGKHRSVAVTEHLRSLLHGENVALEVRHQDIDKD